MNMTGNSILVPVLVQRATPVPGVVSRLLDNRFAIGGKAIPVLSDFDDTLVSTPTDTSKRPTLDYELIESPLVGLLRKEVSFAVITGSKKEEIDKRLINPLRNILQRTGELGLLQRFQVYTNGGALRLLFQPDGQLDEGNFRKYADSFKIPAKDGNILTKALNEAGFEYWEKYQKARNILRAKYPSFHFRKPVVENQDGVKLTLSPLPPKERDDAIRAIKKKLKDSNGPSEYQIKQGGRSTIDVIKENMGKHSAIRDIMLRAGITETEEMPLIYFGDSFYTRHDFYGKSYDGDDMSVLDVLNVVPIAVNHNQEEIPADAQRIIHGGSGPQATLAWLTYFNHQLESNQ